MKTPATVHNAAISTCRRVRAPRDHRRPGADRALTGTWVVMLTTFDLDEYVFEALHAGASGFVLKDADPEELLRAARLMATGESLLSPAVTSSVIARFVRRGPGGAAHPRIGDLTERPLTPGRRPLNPGRRPLNPADAH